MEEIELCEIIFIQVAELVLERRREIAKKKENRLKSNLLRYRDVAGDC